MIYLKHDTRQNLKNADGTNDGDMKRDIIMSEIAKLIAIKPEVVVGYLTAAGFKVPNNPSSKQLVKLTSDAIFKSKLFTLFIAEEIIGMGRVKSLNGDGGQQVDWNALAQSTVALVNSIGENFGKGKNNKDKQNAQNQLQQNTNAIHGITNDGLSTSTKVLIGFAIAVPLLVGGFFAIRAINK